MGKYPSKKRICRDLAQDRNGKSQDPFIGNIDSNPKTVVKFHPVDLFPITSTNIHRFCRQICLFRYFYRSQGPIFFFADKTAAITASLIGLRFHLSDLTTDSGESAHMTIALAFEKKEIVEWTVWKHVSTRIVVERERQACCSTRDFVESVRREFFSTTFKGDLQECQDGNHVMKSRYARKICR